MRYASLLSSMLIAGCFSPQPQPVAPCANGRCPDGLKCSPATDTCEREVRDLDAAINDASSDASPDGPIGLVPCLRDDFNDGNVSDWMTPEGTWALAPGGGPDGSTAWATTGTQGNVVTHTTILGVREARVSLDFRINNAATGDFFIRLYVPGWIADPPNGTRYTIGMYAMGGDDPNDRIYYTVPPAQPVDLTSRPTTIVPSTWHRLEVVYGADRSIRASIDQQPYMMAGPNTTLSLPLDIAIRTWGLAVIDNVSIDCAR